MYTWNMVAICAKFCIPDVHMETCHGYHVHKIELEIESVPTCQVSMIFSWLTCLVSCCFWAEMWN